MDRRLDGLPQPAASPHREVALKHAAGRLEDAVYPERMHELRDATENLERTSADGISQGAGRGVAPGAGGDVDRG